MNTIEKDNYILINSEEISFTEFISEFEKKYEKIKNNNLILTFLDGFKLNTEEISLLLPYSEQSQQNSMTFIVAISNIDIDTFPETFNIVPTLQEAEDILEMEEIQRDLGL